MPSVLKRVEVDEAQATHRCKANETHRVSRGERRLSLHRRNNWEHYCIACGLRIVQENIAELQRLQHLLLESRDDLAHERGDSVLKSSNGLQKVPETARPLGNSLAFYFSLNFS